MDTDPSVDIPKTGPDAVAFAHRYLNRTPR
jgi:hypothetical protein